MRWLRRHASMYQLDADRFGAWGPSAGGHLVALLGTSAGVPEMEGILGERGLSTRVQAVVDWYGPLDLLQMDAHRLPDGHVANAADSEESQLLGGPLQTMTGAARAANPITYISPDDPPFLIFHGDQDPVVPHHQSVLLHDALRAAGVPVEFRTVKGAGHGGPMFTTPEMARAITTFLDRHLKR